MSNLITDIIALDAVNLATVCGGAETKVGGELEVDPTTRTGKAKIDYSQTVPDRVKCMNDNARRVCDLNLLGHAKSPEGARDCADNLNRVCGAPPSP